MTPGPELDAKIAKEVMKWLPPTGISAMWEDENGEPTKFIFREDDNCGCCKDGIHEWPKETRRAWFSPSTSIAVAWDVWERIRSLSLSPNKNASCGPIPNAQPWIRFVQCLGRVDMENATPSEEMGQLWSLWCLTPERICLAALTAIGAKF